jgi:glycosyltransferase involved in cell wall biosynthesis
MSYINRRKLLVRTLRSITRSEYKNIEVIAVDDASEESERIEDLANEFPFLRVIRVEKVDKWYVSGSMPWNRAIANCQGDIVLMQNPECLHVHDVLSYVAKNINDSNYISISAYSLDKTLTELLPGEDYILKYFKTLPQQHVNEYVGWYNHSKYNETYYPFCAALTRKNMDEIGGFDERYAAGVGFEDNDFVNRITRMGLNKIISDDVSVIHQWHPKIYDLANKQHEAYWYINSFGYKITENDTHWSVKNSYK